MTCILAIEQTDNHTDLKKKRYRVDGVLKGCRLVLFKDEMTNPGESITLDQSHPPKLWLLGQDQVACNSNDVGGG